MKRSDGPPETPSHRSPISNLIHKMPSFSRFRPASPKARLLFFATGVYNILVSLGLAYIARSAPQVLGSSPIPVSHMFFVDLMAILNSGYGIGYLLAWLDFQRFYPFIMLGIGGKAAVAVATSYYFLFKRSISATASSLALSEGFLALLFYRALADHAV